MQTLAYEAELSGVRRYFNVCIVLRGRVHFQLAKRAQQHAAPKSFSIRRLFPYAKLVLLHRILTAASAAWRPSAMTSSVPSEEEIQPVLDSILRASDLDKTTLRVVMSALAEHFGLEPADLAVRKKFVRRAIEHFLDNSFVPNDKPKKKNAAKNEPVEATADAPEVADEHESAGSASESEGETTTQPRAGAKRSRKSETAPRMGKAGTKVVLTNLEKAVVLAEPLADFLGELVLPRTHVARRIQQYVKEKKLQDPNDGRQIIADEPLRKLFNCDKFTFFSVNKLMTNLIYKVAEVDDERLKKLADECNEKTLIEKQRVYDDKVARGEPVGKMRSTKPKGRASKRLKEAGASASDTPKKKSGIMADMRLSPVLADICGGEVMSRQLVLRNIWVYIKKNSLNSKGKVHCDEKLQEICGGEKEVSNFGISKYLSAHLTKIPSG